MSLTPSPRVIVPCLLITGLLLSGGCAQTRRYNVQVLNRTDGPITVGLAKEGGPFEAHLASPEDLALSTPASDENLWPCEVVAPGRIGYTRVEGKFDAKSDLTVRVYGGKHTLSEILSISRGTGDRVEAILQPEPAMNKLIVTREEGQLRADAVQSLPQTTTTTTVSPAGK